MFRRAATNLRFLRRRPDLIARAAANVLQVAVGRPRLRSLDVDLTYRCPCSCAQCYSETYLEAAAEGMLQRLSAAEVGDCARQAAELGALMVSLTGGEPLMRKDLPEVISACRGAGVLVSMCTSGVGLTRARLDALAEVGLGAVLFSLDSTDPEEHDQNRGIPGLHRRVVELIDGAKAARMPVIVNTVATREKLASGELERLRRLVIDHGAILNLTVPTPAGRWEARAGDVVLREAEVEQLFAFLRRPGVRTDTDLRYGGGGCPAGDQKLSVGAYGEVRSCQLVTQVIGDVRAEPLAAIWERARASPIGACRQRLCPAADPVFRARYPALFQL